MRRWRWFYTGGLAAILVAGISQVVATQDDQVSQGRKYGVIKNNQVQVDLRSLGRQIADETLAALATSLHDGASPIFGTSVVPQIQLRGGNVQVNDPALDNIQTFPNRRPFVLATQSETSIAAFERNIVAVYNSSASQTFVLVGSSLFQTSARLSAFSTSNDGGNTWTSGLMPTVPGSAFTFGDPVVDVDRDGVFYFAGLGANAAGQFTIQTNKSTDGGRTWSPAVVVQQDNGGDKEWLAVGPDPSNLLQTNVYVTWTSFQATGAQLRFGRSTDGGATWTTKTIFAPPPDPNANNPQNSLQFSNPYVDPLTGRLYVPFLQFSNADSDYIRILASDDAGQTFQFLNFNVPGAPSPSLLPIVQPGTFIDCGNSGGGRLAIHSGPNIGGRFGFPSYVNATRLVVQPAFAARNGVLYLAWSNSTSSVFGDPASNSNIIFIGSADGGQTWSAPIQVNPVVATDVRQVLPSLAIAANPNDVHVLYYSQHTNGKFDVDMANSHDRGGSFPANATVRLTPSSEDLPPTNIPLSPPSGGSYNTTNYDRTIRPCYALGEYLSATWANGAVHALWGDTRNTIMQPVHPLDPISGLVHPQEDVFYQKVKSR